MYDAMDWRACSLLSYTPSPSSFLSEAKKLSAAALSQQFYFRLMLCTTP